MTKQSIWRIEKYNPSATFRVLRSFTFAGRETVVGEVFVDPHCSNRRRRQLFEMKRLGQEFGVVVPPSKTRPHGVPAAEVASSSRRNSPPPPPANRKEKKNVRKRR